MCVACVSAVVRKLAAIVCVCLAQDVHRSLAVFKARNFVLVRLLVF